MNAVSAYAVFYRACLGVLITLLFASFVRAVKGPSIADRIVAVNMMGTQTIVMIAVTALMLEEGYLTDVAMLYAMISFLAVVVLCKVYMGVFLERRARDEEGKKNA